MKFGISWFRCFLLMGVLSLIISVAQWLGPYNNPDDAFEIRGDYAPSLAKFQFLEELDGHISGLALNKSITPDDTSEFVQLIDSIVSHRFYHGTARLTFSDNYLSYLLGSVIWSDLLMESTPNTILKHRVAVCNQTNIVFQSLLKRRGYRFRTVAFDHHQYTEVYYAGGWHVHDCDYEPRFQKHPPPSTKELLTQTGIKRAPFAHVDTMNFNLHFDEFIDSRKAYYKNENQLAAQNLALFHSLTWYYSQLGWLLWFIVAGILYYRRKQKGPCAE